MLRSKTRPARIFVSFLVALAISLVVNFSYLLLLLADPGESHRHSSDEQYIEREGWLHVSPDGHGYLLSLSEMGVDSLYVSSNRINWWKLQHGDQLVVCAQIEDRGHPRVREILIRNGEKFDEAMLYHRPSKWEVIGIQLLFYLILSFLTIMLMITGGEKRNYSLAFYFKQAFWCLLLALVFFVVAPVQRWRTGELVLHFQNGNLTDYMVLLRVSFTVVASCLYGYIFGLLSKSQRIALENEHLKNENLTSRYNMLASQVNPHFFFNSLNSLAMLVREGQTSEALNYIDRLSYTFRYILQSSKSTLVPLSEELRFAEAYGFLFQTRYVDKLFFDIEVEDANRYMLPALTLQPLMGNAVKHNTITRQCPLRVSIRVEQGFLIVENPRRPKLEPEPGMGIGLENLQNRWELITGERIEITKTDSIFRVRMPLQKM